MTYDICGVDFEVFDSENGISVSGGADSALLLFFLLKYSKNKIHIFTLCNNKKGTTTLKHAVDIVYECAKSTNNYNFEHHISYIPRDQTVHDLIYLPRKIIKNGYIYSGITANPPKEISDSFHDSNSIIYSYRDPNIKREYIFKDVYRPWTNIDKKKISEIYNHYNLMETLFPLTRSCETLEKITTVHCGKCWWCNEREWGFGRL